MSEKRSKLTALSVLKKSRPWAAFAGEGHNSFVLVVPGFTRHIEKALLEEGFDFHFNIVCIREVMAKATSGGTEMPFEREKLR